MQSYLNLRLLYRDEQINVVPLWATEWRQTNEGIYLTLNPKARWQDGTPATAEDLKANIEALMGRYSPKRPIQAGRSGGADHRSAPSKTPRRGTLSLKTLKQGERIVWERWEDFWGDYPYWRKPQHRVMEWLQVPDDAARYALFRGKQVDMMVNIPYAIAKNLPHSESGTRGVNPNKGPVWTQTHLADGKMQITFDAEFIVKEKSPGWEEWQNDPTLNPKVHRALELAIDKRAIVENFHYGFTTLNQSIYSIGSFGWRKEQGEKISPYDPKRTKELLAEAGHPNGFSTTIHFGVFTGRPGQPEALEAVTSYWKDIGVDLKIVQHDATEFFTRVNRPDRAYRPMTLVTWGHQEAGEYIAEQAASSGGAGPSITTVPTP